MSTFSEQQSQYYLLKGVLSDLPKYQQDKIAKMKARFRQIIDEDIDIAPVAVSMAMHEAEQSHSHEIGDDSKWRG